MAQEESRVNRIGRIAKSPLYVRNIATSAHIHHGKTAFTDNLLAAAGYMAAKNAGNLDEGMATWGHSDEQERLLTVDAANVSMVHNFEGKEYLINLIDTPGHIDFSGNVTRAMRAIDGTIVLVCASEGIMPQTETVIKQALKERVKPMLFINKVDRLIKELKLTPEKMQERFLKIYEDFNRLIEEIAEPEFKQKWKVDIMDGSVAFGSAKDNFGMSVPFMKKKNISFRDIIKLYEMTEEDRKKWIWANAPLYEVILDAVIKHLPNPVDAQKYRIPKIWNGDLESELGQSLLNCDPKGKLAFVITRIVMDPISGKEISAGRLFSGTIRSGMDVYLNLAKQRQKIQQVLIYNGVKAESIDDLPAGNVLAISGINGCAGETITSDPEEPFLELKHIFEPVITKAIEPVKLSDLPKLIEVLKKVAKEDPSIKIQINEETGENLMHGMGELHLEIIENRIKTEKNVDVKTSPPIVVYRETITKQCPEAVGKSPNKHNLFFFEIEPLESAVYESMKKGEINEGRIKKKDEILWNKLSSLGVSNDEARQYKEIYKNCALLDKTKGIVQIGEVMGLVMDAFEQVIDAGPLAREPVMRLKVSITDLKLHEDAIHRGPAQVYPAVRDALKDGFMKSGPAIFEPIQTHLIECPVEFMGAITKLVTSKRGQLLNVDQEGNRALITGKLPVAEMLGWSSDLRSATEGRGISSLTDQAFEKVPASMQDAIIKQIRARKGLGENA
jgi:elongation factor 2